jgi:hypothetical protein
MKMCTIVRALLTIWLLVGGCLAQTTLHLSTQSRSADFSTASLTKPMKTGSSLPASCGAGEMYLLLSGQPGMNIYACTAQDTWTVQGGTGAGGGGGFGASFTSRTSVVLSHGFGTTNVLVGCYSDSTPPIGIAPSQVEITDSNTVTVSFSSAASGSCVVVAGGASEGSPVSAGIGLVLANDVMSVDTALVPTLLTDTGSLDFGALAAGTCGELSFPLAGASPGDPVAQGWPNTLEAELHGIMYVGAANSVTVRVCNASGSSVDPVSQTFGASIARSF